MSLSAARERTLAHLAFALYVVLLAVVGMRHEPWFDEAQAWLIARDETPRTILAHVARYEGTPGLWHVLLWTVQRLGLPYGSLWLLSAALAAGGSALILYRAPFPLWLRVGLIFGYFPAYQFAVVARSYALDMLLFPLIATLWAARTRRPLAYALALGLAANTNAYGFLLVLPLAAAFAWTLRSRLLAFEPGAWAAGLAYGALALLAVWQAWPPPDPGFVSAATGPQPLRALVMVGQALIDSADPFSATPSPLALSLGLMVSLLTLLPIAILCVQARLGALFGAGLLVFLAFATFKYGNRWHAGLLFLYLVALIWIAWDERGRLTALWRRALDGALALLVAYGVAGTAMAAAHDVEGPSSSSVATARLIQSLQASRPGLTVAALGYGAFDVQPFFARNLFVNYEGGAPRPAYYRWSSRQPFKPSPSLSGLDRLLAANGPDVVLLSLVEARDEPSYLALARARGYCRLARLHGALLWRAYTSGDDDVTVLAPCSRTR